jgi:hypothetical protein
MIGVACGNVLQSVRNKVCVARYICMDRQVLRGWSHNVRPVLRRVWVNKELVRTPNRALIRFFWIWVQHP